MPKTPDVITRFAPSPTGHLHIGGARTALFCWAFAKRYGGQFVLRIEDTDAARSSDESAKGIMEDLAWLGIEWNEGPELQWQGRTIGGDPRGVGPFFQARRLDLYNAHIMRLVEQGKAYPAIETEEELAAEKKRAQDAKANYRYSRASLTKIPDIKDRLRLIERGEPHVIRFFSPAEEIAFTDQVLGDVKIASGEVDDFIIRRRDGFPMYNFAVVVDDHGMGITHVLRAQEHLSNTPRQIALYRAFGYTPPLFGHMPLIFNMDSSKMSKRDKAKVARKKLKDAYAQAKILENQSGPSLAVSKHVNLQHVAPSGDLWNSLSASMHIDPNRLLEFMNAENDAVDIAKAIGAHFGIALPEIEVADFRANGYTPAAICNFVALLGWNPGLKTPDGKDLEKFDTAFLSQHFDLARIGKTNSKFDRAKLLSFNSDAIGAMTDEAFVETWLAFLKEFEPGVHTKMATLPVAKQLLLARALKPRAKTFRDATRPIGFLFVADGGVEFDPAAVEKNLRAGIPTTSGESLTGLELLRALRDVISSSQDFDPPQPQALEAAISALAEAKGVKLGSAAQALRVALTGTGVSPALGDTLAILGKASVLARVDRAIQACT